MILLAICTAVAISAAIVLSNRLKSRRPPAVLRGVDPQQSGAASATQVFEPPPGREEVLKDRLRVPLLIDYRDVKGVPTRRTIVVHQAVGLRRKDGSMDVKRLNAYCLLRRGPRQFLVSRIDSMADPVTGEVIEDIRL